MVRRKPPRLSGDVITLEIVPVKQDMARTKTKQKHKPPGPAPEVLKIEGDWKEAVKKALKVKKPPGGWPKPEKSQRTKRRAL